MVRQLEEIAAPDLVRAGRLDREVSLAPCARNEAALGKEIIDGPLAELGADDPVAPLGQPDHVEAFAA
ncbi:MAG: hypothetical protein WDN31_19745 [Hyphomicrobium sp.]